MNININTEYVPEYLTSTKEKIFENDIFKRTQFADFMFNNKIIFDKVITNINNIVDEHKCLMWIGGSRSWYNLIEENYLGLVTDSIEYTSILPGNYDIFCICPDDNILKEILCKVKLELDSLYDLFSNTDTLYKCYSSIVDKTRSKKCSIKNTDICVFDPCYSLHLRIKTQEEEINRINCEKGKTLIYFECITLPNKNLNKIKEFLFIQNEKINYLNLYGLYLFSQLILNSRTVDKGYNIDYYRNIIIKRIIKDKQLNEKDVYKKLISYYNYLFKGTKNYKDYDMDNLIKTYIDINDPELISSYESILIEKLRIYVNSFIVNNVQDILSNSKYLGNTFIFECGGDAMRRYINAITQTNDFDFKLYYNDTINNKDLKNDIITEMCKFITFLYDKKHTIFKNVISSTDFNCKLESLSSQSGQFRIRYIKKNDKLPVDLLSIDYRYKLNLTLDSVNYKVKMSLPFLDIVLQENTKNIKSYNVINETNRLNVASSSFLYNDLISIYTEYTNAKIRFNNNKQNKDLIRFNALKYFIYKKYLNTYYSHKRKRNDFVNIRKEIQDNLSKKHKVNKDDDEEEDKQNENNIILLINTLKDSEYIQGKNLNKYIISEKWYNIMYSSNDFEKRYKGYNTYFNLKEKKTKEFKIQIGFNDIKIISTMVKNKQTINLNNIKKNIIQYEKSSVINDDSDSDSESDDHIEIDEIENDESDILNQLEKMTIK